MLKKIPQGVVKCTFSQMENPKDVICVLDLELEQKGCESLKTYKQLLSSIASCLKFFNLIARESGRTTLKELVIQVAKIMCGQNRKHNCLLLLGEKDTGKSTFLNCISNVLSCMESRKIYSTKRN